MDAQTLFTTIIPILLVVCIVYYNMRKINRNIKNMKNGCGGNCKGCAHSTECQRPEKKPEE